MLSLSASDLPEVRSHLSICHQCAGFFADLCALEDLTHELASTHHAPLDFRGAVMNSLPRHRVARSVVTYTLVPVLLAAALFAVDRWSGAEAASDPARAVGVLEDPLAAPAESERSDYVDVVIEDPVRGKVIVRVPAVIQLQRASEARDPYVHKVSF